MKQVNMHEAKTTLSYLVSELKSGAESEIVISISNTPAARLIPYGSPPQRVLGIDDGLCEIPDSIDDDDAALTNLFENGPIFPDVP